MQIIPLGADNQAQVLAYLRAAPYRNALPLSNATQLRARCDLVVAEAPGGVRGVASTYHDLPVSNLAFAADTGDIAGWLIDALASRNPRLRAGPSIALLPAARRDQLARHARVISWDTELQMVAEPESLRASNAHHPRRLVAGDLPQIDALARAAGLDTWHRQALTLGPAFGCYDDDRLVAMAGTHFATPEIVEIGFVATHPAYRRRGFASACTSALAQAAFRLAPRVFLMVLEHNTAAVATYKCLGFHTIERVYLTRFQL